MFWPIISFLTLAFGAGALVADAIHENTRALVFVALGFGVLALLRVLEIDVLALIAKFRK
jgi:hypothetical protein